MGAGGSKPAVGSIVLEAGSGESGDVRRNPEYRDALVPSAFKEVATLYDAFERGHKVSKDKPCFGYRPITTKEVAGKTVSEAGDFVWMTYAEVAAKRDAIGSGLLHLGMAPANDLGHKLIGLYSKNRWEWCVAEQAAHAYGMADVPLYDTLGEEAVAFILQQTGMATVFTDRAGVAKLAACKKDSAASVPAFKFVVSFEEPPAEAKAAAEAAGLTVYTFAEVEAAGNFNKAPHAPPKGDDLGFICYTSGTTGMPKGAMILHRNIVADASSAFTAHLPLDEHSAHLSYLPLAHIFERLVNCAVLMAGASIGFYQGDTLKLMEDIKALRPTIFPSVPRLYNRIYDKIMGGVAEAGGIKAALFHRAYEGKRYWLREGNALRHTVWDRLVFGKIAARVGLDRCTIMLTGSAPIAPHVIEFLRVVFGAHLCEGYGQTECSAAATLTSIADQATIGHVGGPLACNDVKLVSVPEMGYLVTDKVHGQELAADGSVVNAGIPCTGRGEVCYRGHNVFAGYYKDAAKTAEALDSEGWLHSGDIGLWDANGNLRIVDRKKNIFKLSQGEYVAAEKIENVYIKASLVGQAFVYGDSLHAVLVAIIVPDADQLALWARRNGKEGASAAEVCALPEFKAEVKSQMAAQEKEARLQGFEKVKELHLEPAPWTPEDLLTPSFKLKRADAKKKYGAVIDNMYEALGDLVAGKKGLKQGAA